MVNILLEKHKTQYDIYQLTRVFFPKDQIKIIDKREEYLGKGYLIVSSLVDEVHSLLAETKIFLDNELISVSKEFVVNIKINWIKEELNLERNIKIAIRKSLYMGLSRLKDKDLPWGILTGIRPGKIVHELMNLKYSENKILNILTRDYKISGERANLLVDISKRQRKYIYPLNKDRYSLYISIPFCPSICLYCSFPTMVADRYKDRMEDYLDSLIYELRAMKKLMINKEINSVYIGGGTPTALAINLMERLIQEINSEFDRDKIKEFTVEAGRPDTLSEDYLQMLKDKRVDRISINPQTMNDDSLRLIGRNHGSKDIVRAFHLARQVGFDNINMDIIIGLPNEDLTHVKYSLEEIKKLGPDSLTVHSLALKTGSKFKERLEDYRISDNETLGLMMEEAIKYANLMDQKPYYLYRQKQILGNLENIGFAKVAKESLYNMAIMEEKESIIGLGMGAVSKIYFPDKDRLERIANFKDLHEYITRTDDLIERKVNIIKQL